MYERSGDRGPGARQRGERRVGLVVDVENVRRNVLDPAPIDQGILAQRSRELAHEQGRLLIAWAYADWTAARAAAREFQNRHYETRMLPGADAPPDVADGVGVLLSLDVQQTLYEGPELDLVVLVTGDRGYPELVRRLRRADRAILFVGFDSTSLGQTFRGADRFVPLEDLTGLRRRAPGAAPPGPLEPAWSPFVHLMVELEQTMPFVGFGWLLKKKLSQDTCGLKTAQERQDLMDQAVEENILTLYKVDNIEEGGEPVTACRLNREHPLVRGLLGH